MKKVAFVVFIFLQIVAAQGQNKFQFHSQNYAGLLEGRFGSAFQFTTINGIQYRTWFAGVGTGLDWYYKRTVPLFLSISKDFKKDSNTWFVSLDAGTNFVWVKKNVNEFYNSRFTPSFYSGTSIGYKAYFRKKKEAFLFGVGYSFKRLKEKQEFQSFCINPPCPVFVEYYDTKVNRLSVRMGLQF